MNQFTSTNATIRSSKYVRLRNIFALSALLGVGCYNWVLYFARKDKNRRKSVVSDRDELSKLVRKIPTRFLTRVWGRFANSSFSSYFISTYCWVFKCNLEEAMPSDLKKFSTLNEFFTRRLKPDTRPICHDHPVVSPCDGKVLNFGKISADGRIEQIKGRTYTASSLLGIHIPFSAQQNTFHYITIYLSPGDYHHFHSPADWELRNVTHIPGDLLPVSPWILNWVSNIFAGNERVVLKGDWRWGFFSFVAVGALNVGQIRTSQFPSIKTNTRHKMPEIAYPVESVRLRAGSEVGEFRLGSTIVLIFEAPEDFAFIVTPQMNVRYGEPIGVRESELHSIPS